MNSLYVLIVLALGFVGGNVLSLPLSAGIHVTLLDVGVCMLLMYAVFQQEKKRFIPLYWAPIIGFLVIMIVSVLINLNTLPSYVLGGGMLYIFRWILYVAVYWVAASPRIVPTHWLIMLVSSGVGVAVLGLIQYVWYPDLRNLSYMGWDPHYQRLFSSLLDPNFTGIILVMTILVLCYLFGFKKGSMSILIFGGIVVGALILTYSRSSLIAGVTGIVVWGVLVGKKRIVAGVLALCIVIIFLLPHTGEGRNLFRTVSSYARLGSMSRAIQLISEKPLFGYGFNMLRYVSTQKSWIDETVSPSRAGAGIDTSLLFVGSTTGITGMFVYGWLMVSLFRFGWKAYVHKSKDVRNMAATYVATLTALVVHSIFINSLFYPWVMVWLWIETGVLEQSVRAGR